MKNKNKKDKEHNEQSSRLHQPQSGSTNTPVNLRSGDKLRESPSNDEQTIEQNPRAGDTSRSQQTPLSKKHEGGRNQVTNEEVQEDVVNPSGGDWDEPQKEPSPKTTPSEDINDDPDGTQRKIPKM